MSFSYPPRPSQAIDRDLIRIYERRGWWAQLKMNGTCSLVHIDPENNVQFWKRDGSEHLAWDPHPEVISFFKNFPDSTFVFELLHSKGEEVRDHAYVFDFIRLSGKQMTGTTFRERAEILSKFSSISNHITIAQVYQQDLTGMFDVIERDRPPLVEGIVLKNPDGELEHGYRENNNTYWQVKCRVSTKNYSF